MIDINLIPPELRKKPSSVRLRAAVLLLLIVGNVIICAAIHERGGAVNAVPSAARSTDGVSAREREAWLDDAIGLVDELLKAGRFTEAEAMAEDALARLRGWLTRDDEAPRLEVFRRSLEERLAVAARLLATESAPPPTRPGAGRKDS